MGSRVPEAEIYRAGERLPVKRDLWAERLACLMDSAITVGGWSIGLDGRIGLVPRFGDIAGAMISMPIVLRAHGRQDRHRHLRGIDPRRRHWAFLLLSAGIAAATAVAILRL